MVRCRAVAVPDMSLPQDIEEIVKAPIAGGLDIRHLFLLVGLVLVMVLAWIMVLSYIRAAEEI